MADRESVTRGTTRLGPAGEHRMDLWLDPELNARVEAYITSLPVRPPKTAVVKALLSRALIQEGYP